MSMRLIFPLALLLLSGCARSGFYSYMGDTFRIPYHSDPNKPKGSSETYKKVVAAPHNGDTPVMLTERGDIWPAPPKTPPTLRELQAEGAAEMNGGAGSLKPLQPLPQLPGYEVSEPQPHIELASPIFSSGQVPSPHGRSVTTTGGTAPRVTKDDGTIIVPNGNGTSTVIGPNGSVTTIPTPKP